MACGWLFTGTTSLTAIGSHQTHERTLPSAVPLWQRGCLSLLAARAGHGPGILEGNFRPVDQSREQAQRRELLAPDMTYPDQSCPICHAEAPPGG